MRSSKDAFSKRELKARYGISDAAIDKGRASGRLKAYRLGTTRLLFLRSEVEAWIRGHRAEPLSDKEERVQRLLDREQQRT